MLLERTDWPLRVPHSLVLFVSFKYNSVIILAYPLTTTHDQRQIGNGYMAPSLRSF